MKHENMGSFQLSNESVDQSSSIVRGGFYEDFGKRLFDIVLAIVLLPILVPAILVLWAMTVRDGGVGFYGHSRVGQGGDMFRCWKIRSMVVDADEKLARFLSENPQAADEWERDHKLTDDPRVTRFGKFIRATSLDELPQIWNVLKGEMSFVGPRPIVQEELLRYGAVKPVYLALKPGITGLWQTSGRNDISYDERVQLDLEYAQKRTFALDCQLIMKTAGSVLARTGR